MAVITAHAAQRYAERVAPVDPSDARLAMLAASPAIDCAARIGCDVVVLGNGARLVLDGDIVVTVLSKRRGRRSRA